MLVLVALRDESKTVTVAGNGATWDEILDLDNAQGQNGINVFRAQPASPTGGAITVTLSGNTKPAGVHAIRLSGVLTGNNGADATEATASDAGPPATDDRDMLVSVTALTNGAWCVGFGAHRNKTFSADDETEVSYNLVSGSGGDQCNSSSMYIVSDPAAAEELGSALSLNSATDWCIWAGAIKPDGGGGGGLSIPVAEHSYRQRRVA